MSGKQRIDDEPAFVLHSHAFKETSLLVEVLSRNHGRVALVARGARRPRAALRGLLIAFQPLDLGWFGQAEVRTLAKAEWQGGQPLLGGQALLCGYYVNELLLKLLPRDDPHPALFDAYQAALRGLSLGPPYQIVLRRFEMALLKELGYGLTLDLDADTGSAIIPGLNYAYIIERGPVRRDDGADQGIAIPGRVLLNMAANDWNHPETLSHGKVLMRSLIQHYLGNQTLQSRRVFVDLQDV
ncbi:MAG TPA: DNA repair protein RecO [Rhodocyclaceae bacterium]|nr:DNA repair protein RecO [Rhodocyclaceae bacterium]HNH13851.1 DNA repair protein RecO [Rhodocyclaceae bacterium]